MDRSGKLVDQPVTFHTRIKSSGYGQVPQDAFARKKFIQAKAMRSSSAPRRTHPASVEKKNRIPTYPIVDSWIRTLQPRHEFPTAPSDAQLPAIFNISYSGDGLQLAVASADSAVLSIKLPVPSHAGEGTVCK